MLKIPSKKEIKVKAIVTYPYKSNKMTLTILKTGHKKCYQRVEPWQYSHITKDTASTCHPNSVWAGMVSREHMQCGPIHTKGLKYKASSSIHAAWILSWIELHTSWTWGPENTYQLEAGFFSIYGLLKYIKLFTWDKFISS